MPWASIRLRLRLFRTPARRAMLVSVALLLIAGVPFALFGRSEAVMLSFRQLQLSDGTIGSTGVHYKFQFNTNTSGPLGSVKFEFCANYQYNSGDPCTPPAGFSAAGASLVTNDPSNTFTISPSSTASKLLLVRPVATNVTPQQLTFEFAGMTNPSDIGSYYVRIETRASTDGNGPEVDSGIVVFATNESIQISTEVPPYLQFCTGITITGYNCGTAEGSFISFGELSSRTSRTATSQMLASTNAPYGYSVILAGTTMTAGTNSIPAMNGGRSVVGTSQFGINSRLNTSPNVGNDPEGPGLTMPHSGYNTQDQYRFNSGDTIASSNNTDDYRKLTVSYLVNTASGQPAGRYVATISYICLANF